MVERLKHGCARLLMCLVLCALPSAVCWAKVPDAYRGVRLGMPKSEVIRILEKAPGHFPYDDMGDEVAELIRGDRLFRHATYKFDDSGILVEIALDMREVLGREQVLKVYDKKHGLNLSGLSRTAEGDHFIEVRGNKLIMKKGRATHAQASEKVVPKH